MAGGGRLGNARVFLREPGALRPVSPRRCASASRRVGPGQAHPPHVAAENGVIDRPAKWVGGVALVAALVACAHWASAEPRLRPSITITEEFSDNIDLEPDNEQSAFVTRVIPGLSFRGDTSRFTGGFDGAIATRYATAGQDSGFQVSGGLTAEGDLQLVRDRLSLEGQASISQQVLNNEQAQTEANLDTVQVYQVSPVLRNRIGGLAVSEVRYILGQILANGNDLSDTTAHVGQATLASGSDFDRLRWLLDGRISEAIRSGDSNVSRRDVGLETEYGLTRWLSAIASGGYQTFDDGDPEAKFDSPTYRGGFRWRPGRRTDIALTYGKSDDRFSPSATLRYQITEASHFMVRYSRASARRSSGCSRTSL
jgi:uncharacterized protein (PEP-CTERM system associated)